jgi:hypothetical protein
VTVQVTAAGPPAFTWVTPVDGAVVDLNPGGGSVEIRLTTSADQYYPFAVGITRDGMTTTEQFTGTEYRKTIGLALTPLGPRAISVTCTDPDGRASTQSRSIVGHDGSPPAVAIGPFDHDVTVTSLPFQLVLTGTTSGAASGVTDVRYSVTDGPSGAAEDTAPGRDWATWRAVIFLPTTGTFQFTIVATDTRGGTGSASASITLHL